MQPVGLEEKRKGINMSPWNAGEDERPSADSLLQAARDLVPILRARARATEARRRLLDETVRDFSDAGFFRVLQPALFRGYEMDYGFHMRLAMEVGRGCASSAWVLGVIASHAWILGMFSPQAQEEVWGEDPEALIATSFLPQDPDVARAADGVVVSGRWKFSSGVDICRWALPLIGVPPLEGDGPPELCLALVPLEEVRIEDTWHVSGLAGTGSNDFVLDRHFVPGYRLLSVAQLRGGPTPGSTIHQGHIYRLPLWSVFSLTLIGAAVGAARGAIELVVEGLTARKSVAQVKLAEQQSVQLRIARATARVDTAEASLLHLMAIFNRDARAGIVPPLEERARYRLDVGFAGELCVEAVDILYPLLGGRGLVATDPVQRAWRDVHAITQHIALVPDVQAGLYGPVRLGLPCPDPKL